MNSTRDTTSTAARETTAAAYVPAAKNTHEPASLVVKPWGSIKIGALLLAVLSALLYSLSIPISKVLLEHIDPLMLAAALYGGAGLGVAVWYGVDALVAGKHKRTHTQCADAEYPSSVQTQSSLCVSDIWCVLAMVVLNIASPILLLFGIQLSSASSASLLSNFEIVATALFAFLLLREHMSRKFIIALALITCSSIILSVQVDGVPEFSWGSLLIVLATMCWGLENICTRALASKNTFQVVIVKGLACGAGALALALFFRAPLPSAVILASSLIVGFLSYGVSIFLYIRAQDVLGAAKTSACYAVAPFIGAACSMLIMRERCDAFFLIAAFIMLFGSILVVYDTIVRRHVHVHTHTITCDVNGTHQVITITHEHSHYHLDGQDGHTHMFSNQGFSIK